MLAEHAGRLPARLEASAKDIYSRTRVDRCRRWLDAGFVLRFAYLKDGGVRGAQNPIAMRSDAPPEYGNPAHQKFG